MKYVYIAIVVFLAISFVTGVVVSIIENMLRINNDKLIKEIDEDKGYSEYYDVPIIVSSTVIREDSSCNYVGTGINSL